MVDALVPAVRAMEDLVEDNKPDPVGFEQLLMTASQAAGEGAEATKGMIARHGHSKTLGERALGHPDPGAVSVFFIFDAMSEWAQSQKELPS